MGSKLRYILFIGLLTLACIQAGFTQVLAKPSEPVVGPLDRPSMKSLRATTSALLSVARAGKRLVAVGERGHIIYSDDNGASWKQAEVPVSVTLTKVKFVTSKNGWALGQSGTVLHTDDGGETWVKQLDGIEAAQLVLESAKRNLEVGKGDPEKLKRELSNAQMLVDDGPDKPFLDMYFLNQNTGLIVGAYNLAFLTEDGGVTWQPWLDNVENPRALHLYSINKAGKNLYAAGEQGLFLRAPDGDLTFNAISTPYDGSYFGLLPLKSGELLIFGLRGNAFISDDQAATWKPINTGATLAITAAIELRDGTLVLTTQSGTVLVSDDKGQTFKQLPIQEPFSFADVTEAANGSLILVGMRGVEVVSAPGGLSKLLQNVHGES